MLNYSDQGEGEALVFLHGFCSDLTLWHSFIGPFTEEYRVICIDLPGCGKSPLLAPSLSEWAKACWDTLNMLGIDECHIIGHSMGGYIALELLAQQPQRMRSFVSFHSSPLPDNDERRNNRYRQQSFIDKYGPKMLVQQIVPALFHADFDEVRMMKAVAIAENQSADGLKASLAAMAKRSDHRNTLYAAEMPVLFLSGLYDSILPIKAQKEFAKACKKAHLLQLDQTAHMGMIEEEGKCQERIAEFLAEQH